VAVHAGGTYYPREAGGKGGRRPALAGGMLLALIASGLFFADLGRYPLWDPDEARHAEVARELAEARGVRRLFLPTLGLEPYREKPAGFYWLVALAYRLGGVNAGSARSVSAGAALLLVLAVYAYAVPRTGVTGGIGAGLVLATSAGWLALARASILDMTLTACVGTGVLAGLAWLDRPPPRRAPLAPYVAAALGTLVKGPVATVLVAGPLALAVMTRRPRPSRAELGLGRGLVVAAAIIASLYAPLALFDASYLWAFIGTNLRRFGPMSPHAAPVYYYVVWLPLLLLPWTVLAVPAVVRAARDPARRPLVLWAAAVPTLLTLAEGKVATYALSALLPLALIAGPELARAVRTGPRDGDDLAFRIAGWLGALALVAGAAAGPFLAPAYPVPGRGRALLALVALGWAGGLVYLLRRRRLRAIPAVVLGATLTLYPVAVRFVAPAVSALHSDREVARLILEAGPAPVVAFAARAPSLMFYLRSPVIETEDAALVRSLFEDEAPVFLVTGHLHFDEVEKLLGTRAYRWHATARRRLYANRPPPDG